MSIVHNVLGGLLRQNFLPFGAMTPTFSLTMPQKLKLFPHNIKISKMICNFYTILVICDQILFYFLNLANVQINFQKMTLFFNDFLKLIFVWEANPRALCENSIFKDTFAQIPDSYHLFCIQIVQPKFISSDRSDLCRFDRHLSSEKRSSQIL